MRYGFSTEQQMLAETGKRLIERTFRREVVRAFTEDGRLDRAWTRELAEAGLFGICAPEEAGGLGLGAVDALAVKVEAGRGLLPYPLIEAIVAARLLGAAGDARAAAVAGGAIVPAVAWDGGAVARRGEGGDILDGDLGLVAWAGACDLILVPLPETGVALVDPRGQGVKVETLPSFDKTATVARVRLDGYALAGHDLVEAPFGEARNLATILAAGDLLGAAEAALDRTVAYVKDRQQFGQPVGKYQAIKHILADDALRLESVRVAVLYAGWAFDADAEDSAVALHVAKAVASDGAHRVVEDAVQCHGGIGFTWEYGLHFHMRRIARLARTLGTARQHREGIAEHLIRTVAGRRGAAAQPHAVAAG